MAGQSVSKRSIRVFMALALAGTLPALMSADAGAAVIFTVNATGDQADIDTTDDLCDAAPTDGLQCTLRAAIQQANATAGADTINFDIVGGAALKTISPASPLPTIVEAVTIDGYTQSGASPNTRARGNDAVLRIQLNGTNAGQSAVGLNIDASDTVVRGLVINRFDEGIRVTGSSNRIEGNFIGTNPAGNVDQGNRFDGVFITSGASNVIGGPARSARNLISGNDGAGVFFLSDSTRDNRVVNNYIGTRRDGNAALENSLGVGISSSDGNTVGGASSRLRNVISGNFMAVEIFRGSGNEILGNFVGTNAAGTAAVPNTAGGVMVRSAAEGNTIGGTTAGARNVISGNGDTGLFILDEDATGTAVQGNRIGTNAGTAPLGNGGNGIFIRAASNTVGGPGSASNLISGNAEHGVLIDGRGGLVVVTGNEVTGNAITANGLDGVQISSGATGNLVQGNAIFGNGDDGVSVDNGFAPATGNRILSNQIFGNTALGIDLVGGAENGFGVTANDTDDPDTGSNRLQNFPVIVSATRSNANGVTTIIGSLNSTPNQSFTIQFFVAVQDDSDHGEGQIFLGQTAAATNANGDDGFSFFTSGLGPGQRVTATATKTSTGDTSEFSLNRIVTPGP